MNRFKNLFQKTANCLFLNEYSGLQVLAKNKNINRTLNRCCSNDIASQENEKKESYVDPGIDLKVSTFGRVVGRFNFAMYAEKSPIIQKYIDLGVNLYELEKEPAAASYLLTLSFEKIKPYLFFLTDNGVPTDKLGKFITKNPLIFKGDLDDLEVRINYLKSKKFTKEMISTILIRNPKWLSVPVKKIDDKLGFLQQTFFLTGDQVREMITKVPSLVMKSRELLDINIHALKEEMRLDKFQLKKIVLAEPRLLKLSAFDFISTYEYLTKTMKVSTVLIINQPKALTYRKFLIKQRHLFLESLGRAQYCHLLPGYVDLLSLTETTDNEFCEKIARTSEKLYYDFLKTL